MATPYDLAAERLAAGFAGFHDALRKPTFEQYNVAALAALGQLQDALIRTDLAGKLHATARLDRPGLGSIPAIAMMLVISAKHLLMPLANDLLPQDQQSSGVFELEVPAADKYDTERMMGIIAQAELRLAPLLKDPADLYKPHADVWRGVTLPLLMGFTFRSLPLGDYLGGGAPMHKQPPMLMRIMSLRHNAQWYTDNVSHLQESLADVDTWATQAQKAVGYLLEEFKRKIDEGIIKPARQKALGGLFKVGLVALVGGVLYVVFSGTRGRER